MKEQAKETYADNWVSIADHGLPKEWGSYIVWGSYTKDCAQRSMQCNFYKGVFRSLDGIRTKNVTHWQQMPGKPISNVEFV